MSTDHSTYNIVYAIFAFISFLLCCISLSWQWRSQNSGVCLFLLWIGLACLNQFINAVVWNGNVINRSPIWCDISSHFVVAVAPAIPAAGLCISRRIYHTLNNPLLYAAQVDRYRALYIDLAIGVVLPVFLMIIYAIPQGHRFDIFEDLGCLPATYITPPAIVIVWLPPVIISLISLLYSALALRLLLRQSRDLEELCYKAKYTRLVVLASLDAGLSTPLSMFYLITAATTVQVSPWISWADTHSDFWRVGQVPSVLWRASLIHATTFELSRWILVLGAFIFFGLFGFTREARDNYRAAVSCVSRGFRRVFSFGRSREESQSSDNLADMIRIIDHIGQQSPSQSRKPSVWTVEV